MKRKLNKNLRKWHAIYVAVAIGIIAVICFISFWYSRIFSLQTQNTNEYVREIVVKKIDDFYEQIYALSQNLVTTDQIDSIAEYNTIQQYYKAKEINDLVLKLGEVENIFSDIHYVYLYVQETDTVISSGGMYSSQDFYQIYCQKFLDSYEKWMVRIRNESKEKLFSCENNVIAYNISLSELYDLSDKVHITCGMFFDKEHVFSKTPHIEWVNRCNIYIYDINKRLSIYDEKIAIDRLESEPIYGDLMNLSGDYQIIVNKIGAQHTAVIVFEKNADMKTVRIVELVSVLAVLFYMLIGIWLFYYVYESKFRPVQVLAELLGIELEKLDYHYLVNPIEKLIEKNQNLSEYVKDRNLSVCNMLLGKLLVGEVSAEYISILGNYQIVFDKKNFVVVTVNVCEEDDTLGSGGSLREKLQESITKVLSDETTSVYLTELQSRIVCICNTNCEQEQDIRAMAQKLAYVTNMLASDYNFVAVVAVSDVNEGVDGIAVGYIHSLDVICRKDLFDFNKVVLYTDVKKEISLSSSSLGVKRINLTEAIKYGNSEEACAILTEIFSYLSKEDLRLYEKTVVWLVNVLMEMNEMTRENDDSEHELLFLLHNNNDTERLKKVCLETAMKQCDDMKRQNEGKNSDFAEHIKKFIEENYSNSNFSTDYLSSAMKYSNIHINNLFKKAYGTTPIAYLNEYRIQMAKKFIEQGMMVSEVADKVGFSNVRTFHRAFYNNVKMTPVEYRKHRLQAEEETPEHGTRENKR